MRVRRLPIHLVFAAFCVACAVLAATSLAERHRAIETNRLLAHPRPEAVPGEDPLATLARGVMQARAGDNAGAQRAYQSVLQRGTPAQQRIARYDLGNLHLREAIRLGAADPQALPLTELAKQQYRELLADDPDDWDARYNLERALWIAPEFETATTRSITAPRPRGRTTMKNDAGDLP